MKVLKAQHNDAPRKSSCRPPHRRLIRGILEQKYVILALGVFAGIRVNGRINTRVEGLLSHKDLPRKFEFGTIFANEFLDDAANNVAAQTYILAHVDNIYAAICRRESGSPVRQRDDEWGAGPPFIPVKCEKCHTTHNLHGECVTTGRQTPEQWAIANAGIEPEPVKPAVPRPTECPPSGIRPTGGKPERDFYQSGPGASQLDRHPSDRPRTEQLPGKPKFNSLHISQLTVNVDGHTETLFIAILNGNAVGQIIGIIQPWKACGARMLFVAQKHRHMGIGTRLVKAIEVWAKEQGAVSIEIAVHKGNTAGRTFWIRRRFVDDDERDMSEQPEYHCMVKPI